MPRLTEWRREGSSLPATIVAVASGVAALSTLLPWFAYAYPEGSTSATVRFIGLHDVTGRAMLVAAIVEGSCGLLYRRPRSSRGRQVLRVAMVLLGFVMIVLPFAAMSHVGSVPGAPPDATESSGGIGTVVAMFASFVVLGASWLTVLDPRMAYRRAP